MTWELLICSLASVSILGTDPSPDAPRGYVCVRADGPVKLDGRLDEPAWNRAAWTAEFVDIEGSVKPAPRFHTRAKMLWDDQFFYIAAQLEEPHVWATLSEHDSVIFHDNDFEVFIDPDGDNHEYYELEINALGTEWDLFLKKPYRDGGPALNTWEIPGLRTAVRVDGTLNQPADRDRGWTVELAIPWKVLGEFAHRPAPPREGDQWRVNFSRVEWEIETTGGRYTKRPGRKEDNWVWSPQGAIDMHRPERWGTVQFTSKAPNEVQFRRDPATNARDNLMKIYHAQRAFRMRHGRWAANLAELELNFEATQISPESPTIRLTPDGYEAATTVLVEGSAPRRWTVRQDSRIEAK